LGGSSILNIMAISRGNAKEYDAFEALGSPGWNWDSLLQYFKKSETFTATSEQLSAVGIKPDPKAHGSEGPLQISVARWLSEVNTPFRSTLNALGIQSNPDNLSGDNTGVSGVYQSIHPSEVVRSSSTSAYYQPNKSRNNLRVITGAHVTRVLFDSDKREGKLVATGVQYSKDGFTFAVSAKKEVIICAGSFQSPQILELSGKLHKLVSANRESIGFQVLGTRISWRPTEYLFFTTCLALVKIFRTTFGSHTRRRWTTRSIPLKS